MRATLPILPAETLAIRPWPDPVIDQLGHDPRSAYVERFWLGILGPSTTWFLRRVAAGLESSPAGFDLSLADTARSLGLGGEGRHSPFLRAIGRCCQFELALPADDGVLAVRRKLPPLNRRQLARLPEVLQEEHRAWQDAELHTPPAEALRRRARRLALSLLELGEGLEECERQLLRWRFPAVLAREAAGWAWEHHRAAIAAAQSAPDEGDDDLPPAAA